MEKGKCWQPPHCECGNKIPDLEFEIHGIEARNKELGESLLNEKHNRDKSMVESLNAREQVHSLESELERVRAELNTHREGENVLSVSLYTKSEALKTAQSQIAGMAHWETDAIVCRELLATANEKIAELRAGLDKYANKDNWDEDGGFTLDCMPWTLAEYALKSTPSQSPLKGESEKRVEIKDSQHNIDILTGRRGDVE